MALLIFDFSKEIQKEKSFKSGLLILECIFTLNLMFLKILLNLAFLKASFPFKIVVEGTLVEI